MSYGKYSPTLPKHEREYIYNAKGEIPAPWSKDLQEQGIEYDEETMFGDYDSEGYDRYGYSAYTADGKFVGLGQGIDREGMTENDHLDEYLTEMRNGGEND